MPRLTLAALCLVLALPAQAQINTEQLRKSTEEGLHLRLDATGGLAAGNTDFLRLGVGARLDGNAGPRSGFALVRYNLTVIDEATDVSNAFAHVRYNQEIVPDLVGEAFAQVERDEQQLLARRYLIGGGVRFEIVETEAVGFALGTTPMLELERLRPETMEASTQTVRWSNYTSLRVDVSDTAEAFGVVYVQPRLDAFDDFRILHEARLDVDITQSFKVRLHALFRYDSEPPLDVEESDLMVTAGFVFNSLGN